MALPTFSSILSHIHFEVEEATLLEEKLIIVGKGQELGNWDFNKGHPLVTNGSFYPLWRSKKPLISTVGTPLITK